jgi:PAS domain S-box-containing protein
MTWALRGLPGSERLIEYEAKLNEFFPASQCLAICQYDRRRFQPELLLDVLSTHPAAIIGGEAYNNLYYIPPAEFLGQDLPAARLRQSMKSLVEHKRADEEVGRRNEELTALHRVGQAVSGSLDLEAVAAQALEAALKVLDMDAGAVRYVDEDTQELVLLCHQGLPEEMVRQRQARPRVKIGESLAGRVAQLGEPLVVDGFSEDTRTVYTANRHSGFDFFVGLPLKVKGKVVGVISGLSRRRQTFGTDDMELMADLGSMVGMAIVNAQLFEKSQQRARRMEALHQVSQAVSGSLDLETVAALALEAALRVLDLDAGLIRYLDDTTQELVLLSELGTPPEIAQKIRTNLFRLMLGQGLSGKAAQSGEPLVIDDLTKDKRALLTPGWRQFGFQCGVGLPLKVEGRVVGVMNGVSRRRRTFTPADMEMMESLGSMVGMAIANARLYEGQKRRTEELTALHQVGQAVSGSLDLESLAALALEAALGVLGLDAGLIRYVDEATQELVVLAELGLPQEMAGEIQAAPRTKIGEGLAGNVAQSGEPLIVKDLPHDARSTFLRATRSSGFQCFVGLPLKVRRRVVGTISGFSRRQRTFSPAELDMMGSIGNMVGMAIANARLFSQVETAGREWQQSFDAMSEGVSILSTDHRILRANLALARMLGTTPEALVGRHCYEVFHGREEEPLEDCPMTHCMAGKRACDLVRQEPHLGNRWLHLYTDPVLGPQGEVLSVVHTARDITTLKQMEQEQEGLLRAHQEQSRLLTSSNMELENALAKVTQAEEKLQELYKEEKGLRHELQTEMERRVEFTRALVHELKTPLTPVLASSSVLVDELQGEPLLSLARNIEQGASNLNNRIDELLDLARGEIGMLHLNPQPVEPLRLLSVIANYMAPVASSHSQTLTLDLPPSLPLVWADEGRLRQIVLNLLSNAAKFTPEGGKITLRARETGANLVIEVQDSGHGISKEEQQRLFEPYHRLERDRERLSGLGLGLALCKTLVELHGGRIWVESSVGQGSTFIFSVPLKASRPQAKSRKGKNNQSAAHSG